MRLAASLALIAAILSPYASAQERGELVTATRDGVALTTASGRSPVRYQAGDQFVVDRVQDGRIYVVIEGTFYRLNPSAFGYESGPTASGRPSPPAAARARAEAALDGFRGHAWGTARGRVRSAEGRPMEEEQGLLLYRDQVGGLDAHVLYVFDSGRLTAGNYSFGRDHLIPQLHFNDFDEVERTLVEKYGPPAVGDRYEDDRYRSRSSDRGTGLSLGYIMLLRVWYLEGGRLSHHLRSDGGAISHMVLYESDDAVRRSEERIDRSRADDF